MNKELDDEISKIMTLTAEEFYEDLSPLREVVKKVRTYQDFCKLTKLVDVMVVPVFIEFESDFSNSFDFTFGCFSDAINNYALPQNRTHFPPDYTEWTYLAEGLCRALITSG